MQKIISEEEIISLSVKYFSDNKPEIIKSIGDDTAVIKNDSSLQLFTTDMLVDGTHFLSEEIPAYSLGWKAIAVNVSDIASMGGKPTFATLSLGLGKDIKMEWLEELYRGMSECASEYGVSIIGGDTVYSPNIIINIALLGKTDKAVYRNQAKDEYIIAVSGIHGESGAGLKIISNKKGNYTKAEEYCIRRHYMPTPRLKEANFISENLTEFAMLDSSDGLFVSCNLICCESGISGAEIFADKIPLSENLKEVSSTYGLNVMDLALFGGEDFELVMAMSEKDYLKIKDKYQEKFKRELYMIGRLDNHKQGIILSSDNKEESLENKSFQHFHK